MTHAAAFVFFAGLLVALCATLEFLVRRNWPAIRAAFFNERPRS